MALLDRHNHEFRDSVSRSMFHVKTDRLSKLIHSLELVQERPQDLEQLRDLWRRMKRWQKNEPREFAARGARCKDLAQEIFARAADLKGEALSLPEDGDAMPWVDMVRTELELFGTYASADAFMYQVKDARTGEIDWGQGFPACINPVERENVRARYLTLEGTERGRTTPFDSLVSPTEWKTVAYKMAYQRVTTDRAGVCVTFAKAAAHVLTYGRNDGPRVEIVSFANHVYVLVNRHGDMEGENIAADWIHEPKVIIVDPWAAAMGWPCIYRSLNGYPFVGMLNPLLRVAVWTPPEG